jgi:hypothetical protein
MRNPSLFLNDQLSVSRDSGAEWSWQGDSFIKRVGVKRLGTAENSGHALNSGSDDVVVGVLLRQRPT